MAVFPPAPKVSKDSKIPYPTPEELPTELEEDCGNHTKPVTEEDQTSLAEGQPPRGDFSLYNAPSASEDGLLEDGESEVEPIGIAAVTPPPPRIEPDYEPSQRRTLTITDTEQARELIQKVSPFWKDKYPSIMPDEVIFHYFPALNIPRLLAWKDDDSTINQKVEKYFPRIKFPNIIIPTNLKEILLEKEAQQEERVAIRSKGFWSSAEPIGRQGKRKSPTTDPFELHIPRPKRVKRISSLKVGKVAEVPVKLARQRPKLSHTSPAIHSREESQHVPTTSLKRSESSSFLFEDEAVGKRRKPAKNQSSSPEASKKGSKATANATEARSRNRAGTGKPKNAKEGLLNQYKLWMTDMDKTKDGWRSFDEVELPPMGPNIDTMPAELPPQNKKEDSKRESSKSEVSDEQDHENFGDPNDDKLHRHELSLVKLSGLKSYDQYRCQKRRIILGFQLFRASFKELELDEKWGKAQTQLLGNVDVNRLSVLYHNFDRWGWLENELPYVGQAYFDKWVTRFKDFQEGTKKKGEDAQT